MKTLHIIVSNKVASYLQRDGYIVCGNSDNQVEFTFDAEWDAYTTKTARFIWGGKYKDVTFSGNVCPVPIVANTEKLEVGVYVENLSTTTSAVIPCRKSILCHSDIKSEGTVVVPEGTPVLGEATITENGEHYPGEGYDGFYKVTVKVAEGGEIPEGYIKPTGTKVITENGTHDVTEYASVEVEVESEGEVIPEFTEVDDFAVFAEADGDGSLLVGYDVSQKVALPAGSPARLASVSDEDFIADNIRKGKNIFGLEGAFEGEGGGGAELNIAYGDTAPEDTSKLWVKTTQPSAIKVSSEKEYGESLENSLEKESITETLSAEKRGLNAAVVGTKVYLFGDTNTKSKEIYCFDTETQTIQTLAATLPTALLNVNCAAVGTKIYLLGGYSSSAIKTIVCFDTETQTIQTLSATLPTAISKSNCAAVGTKIYLLGTSESSAIYCFDTQNQTVETLTATLPFDNYLAGCAAIGTKIYLLGGNDYYGTKRNTIICFNTETQTVEQLSATLPTVLNSMGCAAVGTKIYLLGGGGGSYNNATYCFDTETQTVKTLSTLLPNKQSEMGCAAIGTKIYLFGGNLGGGQKSNAILCYITAVTLLSANSLQIIPHLIDNVFYLINEDTIKVKIGVSKVYKGNADGIAEEVEAALHNGTSWVTI